MISHVEVRGYRCLRYVAQELRTFQVLVGQNASGKSTFLDALAFVHDLLLDGLEAAIATRSSSFYDLTWERTGNSFELAIEASIPAAIRARYNGRPVTTVRYELAIGMNEDERTVEIQWERLLITPDREHRPYLPLVFPNPREAPGTLRSIRAPMGGRSVVTKIPGGNDNFASEVTGASGKGWIPSFKLGPRKSALANLPDDEERFPAATWFRNLMREGLQTILLNSRAMRNPCPPGIGMKFRPDGANLPWVIHGLREKAESRYQQWIGHVQLALPDLKAVESVERKEDRHRYLLLKYANGLEVPSWLASDGTLRLLALTLPAYLPDVEGLFLIEEPENGIHPQAVETVYQALSSVYSAQVLMASHSPVVLANARPEDVLCFGRSADGSIDIVRGDLHPRLREWRDAANIGHLLAVGVL